MSTSTLTTKGQVTIPKMVRDHLHLVEGDRVDFIIEPDGGVRLAPLEQSVEQLFGLLHRPSAKASSIEEMDRAISDDLAADLAAAEKD